MTPDEIARFHSDRPGYELLDYAEVALPVFKVTLHVLLLQHTPLTPMFEFVLKAIRLGIDTLDEIAACLGIPASMVDETLRALHQSEEVEFVDGGGAADQFVLTRRGEKTTSDLERIRPEQQTIRMLFDGLTRKPLDASAVTLLSGREAEDLGMREIPAVPHSRIEVEDIDIVAASRILSRERTGEGRRDLLAIKGIEHRRRYHMPAVALVFQAAGGGEVELLFVDETKMLDDHNRSFALAEGPRKTSLLDEFTKPQTLAQDSFARKVRSLSRIAEPQPSTGRKRTLSAKSPVAQGAVQPLAVQDHPPLLLDALRTARERVLIICPWITQLVVDRPTLGIIEALLKREVRLYIGYGIDDAEDARRKRKPIPVGLTELAERYDNFQLRDFGDTHEKVLIKDDEFEVVGSFNWLSYRGDPARKLRREHSVKLTDAAYVEAQFAVFEGRFRQKPKRRAREVE